jgi:hypothetical protein
MSNERKPPDDQPKPPTDAEVSPAGPHDRPGLTDPGKTPGSGMLPDDPAPDVEGPSG